MTKLASGQAEALFARLQQINEGAIPVMSRERHIPRVDQAALARKLFKQLGLKGISVTTPRYSMAQSVDVQLPRLAEELHDLTKWPHFHSDACCGVGKEHTEATRCPQCRERSAALLKVEEILARAFPQHDNRSDSQTDYFDYCWSVD